MQFSEVDLLFVFLVELSNDNLKSDLIPFSGNFRFALQSLSKNSATAIHLWAFKLINRYKYLL